MGVCAEPGCPNTATHRSRCPTHQTGHPNGSRSGRDLNAQARFARAVKKRDGYRCVICGTTTHLVAHHRTPLHAGGTDAPANGITLCEQHHREADRYAT